MLKEGNVFSRGKGKGARPDLEKYTSSFIALNSLESLEGLISN